MQTVVNTRVFTQTSNNQDAKAYTNYFFIVFSCYLKLHRINIDYRTHSNLNLKKSVLNILMSLWKVQYTKKVLHHTDGIRKITHRQKAPNLKPPSRFYQKKNKIGLNTTLGIPNIICTKLSPWCGITPLLAGIYRHYLVCNAFTIIS